MTKEVPLTTQKHSHYYKDVKHLNVIDVYRVIALWEVQDPCLQHLIKKALCAGGRGHKDKLKDLQDIRDSAQRALDMYIEDTSEKIDPKINTLDAAIKLIDNLHEANRSNNSICGHTSDAEFVNPFLEGIMDELEGMKGNT